MEFLPWKYDPKHSDAKLKVFYGKDIALSLSLAREVDSSFLHENELSADMSILYSEPLLGSAKPVRSIVSAKTYEKLVASFAKSPFYNSCILIVEGAVKTKHDAVDYIKCDELNARTRRYFVDFWCKQLGISLPAAVMVDNLDEIRFAAIQIKLKAQIGKREILDEYTPWNSIRVEQFRQPKIFQGIFKHLELWARNNSPNDEALQNIYEQVKSDIARFKNEAGTRHPGSSSEEL